MKDERERGAILSDKLETAEVELSERLETIEALKTEMAKHKEVAEKSKDMDNIFCVKLNEVGPQNHPHFFQNGLRTCAKNNCLVVWA